VYSFIYCRPMWQIYAAMAVLFFLWAIASCYAAKSPKAKKVWQYLNLALTAVALAAIAGATVLSREGTEVSINWQPFHMFFEYGGSNEAWRLLIMNGFLFFPLGLALPNLFAGRRPIILRILFTVLVCFLLSAVLEQLQYHFSLGVTEIDDIIWNTFGGTVASLHIIFSGGRKTAS